MGKSLIITSDLHEKYCELVENANSIILRMDENGKITFFNAFAQSFFGYSGPEIIGKSVIGTIVPRSDFTGLDLTNMIKDIMVNPQKYINNENENITKDGRHVWVSWTNKPILGADGKLQEVMCIGNDISRLKKAELELAKAKELAEAAGHVGIIVCTPEWKIKAINSGAKNYFHLDAAETSGLDMLAIILKNYTPSISEDQIRDLSAPHSTFELMRPETDNNKALYLLIHKEFLKSPQQEVASIVLSVHDITDQKKEELLKQDFLGLISHKLRTPISVILQGTLMLQQDKTGTLQEDQKALFRGVTNEANRLNGLINNLINFISIGDQKITAEKEEIKVAEYLPRLINPILAQVIGKKTSLNIDCPDNGLAIQMGRSYFDLVIKNLIDNAIKFNDKDTIEIKISAKKENSKFHLTITDNGPGIAVEEQEKIFEMFYQTEKCFTGNVAGAGLGLALVKKIVTAFGGEISLNSDLGKGSAFTIVMPFYSPSNSVWA
ncbi:MAG: ATP-binding protein [Candidatus Margulisiibacteriota bacterium]